MSRHNISQAQQLFAGKATFPQYQQDKLGVEFNPLYRWKPVGSAGAITFTAALAAGALSGTLSANFAGASGYYLITFSDGEQLLGYFTSGATAVSFWSPSFPITGGAPGVTQGLAAAVTTAATIAGLPPVVGAAAFYAASQAVAAAGLAVLTGANPDVPRNVVGAWTTSSTVTVTGLDYYGQVQTEAQTGATFTGKKTFSSITSIKSSAAITAATFGTGNVLGLPFAVDGGDLYAPTFNLLADAGAFVPADRNPVPGVATGDVRGTFAPSGTLNGAKWLTALLKVGDAGTQLGAFGQTPA